MLNLLTNNLMRLISLLLFFLCLNNICLAQITEEWSKFYQEKDRHEEFVAITATEDEKVLVGVKRHFKDNFSSIIYAIDPLNEGKKIWTKPNEVILDGFAIESLSSFGNDFVVAGKSVKPTNTGEIKVIDSIGIIEKYNQNKKLIWREKIKSNSRIEKIKAFSYSKDNYVLILGIGASDNLPERVIIQNRKLNNGKLIWSDTLKANSISSYLKIRKVCFEESSKSLLVLIGRYYGYNDSAILRYSFNGKLEEEIKVNGIGMDFILNGENELITLSSKQAGKDLQDFYISKFYKNESEWNHPLGGPTIEEANRIFFVEDNYLLIGNKWSERFPKTIFADKNGTKIWELDYKSKDPVYHMHVKDVIYLPNQKGYILAATNKEGQNTRESLWLSKFNIDGYKPPKQRRIQAVVTGISDYKYLDDLTYSSLHADRLRAHLKNRRYPKGGNVNFLSESRATKNNILNTIEQVLCGEHVNENDIALFFFSGHGTIIEDVNGIERVGLCTYNFQGEVNEFITHDTLISILSKSPAKIKICLLEACQDYESPPMGVSKNLDKILYNKKYSSKSIKYPNDVIVFTSSQPEQKSYWTEEINGGEGGGWFSHFLLEALSPNGADNYKQIERKNGFITIEELHHFVKDKVYEYSINQSESKPQEPVILNPEYNKNIRIFQSNN